MSQATRPSGEAPTPRFRPHAEYTESGIEWLGSIPVHWSVDRLKNLATLNDDVLPESTRSDLDINYIDIGSVDAVAGITEIEALVFGNAPSRARRLVRDGDVIVSTVRTYLRAIAIICNPAPNLVVSTGFAVLRPRRLVSSFASYALRAPHFLERVVANSVGVSYPAISPSTLGSFELPFPEVDEQRIIADFLDCETAKIDALVAKKERLIQLLQEKRTALITRAVARGLDPNVPMKDSGAEWLGEVPAHWEVKRIKFAARLHSGHTPSRQNAEYWMDCTIPWFGLADVWQVRDGQAEYVVDTSEKISEAGLANSAATLLPKGTVILSRTASVGFSAILGVDMATTQDFVNWICGQSLRPEYLLYVLRAMGPEYRRLTMGSTHQTIYMPDVGTFVTPVPPLVEQDQIVASIRREKADIEALIRKVVAAVEHVKEYRSALISAAVTGKIDVREAAKTR